jgi:hypothetical protein
MEVVTLQVFVSLLLGVSSLLLFGFSCRKRTFEHADRLALLALEDDAAPKPPREPSRLPQGEETS